MGKRRGVYRVLVRKPEEKRPLGRPGRLWKDNITIDLHRKWDVEAWAGPLWFKIRVLMNMVMNHRVP
jgi:hypothetical protein